MLRSIMWLTKVAAFILIGVLTFTRERHGVQAIGWQIGGYAAVGLATLAWAGIEFIPGAGPRRERWLPLVLGLIAAVSGLACTPQGGFLLVVFAAQATMAAGSDIGVVAGWAVTAAGVLGLETGVAVYGDSLGTILGFPLFMLGGLLIGHNRRAYRIQANQSAAMLVQSQQLQVQQRRADVLDERTRIAREIHDVLAHSLGALGIQIQAARAVLSDQHDVERALDVLATAQRMASEGLVETRRAVHALRADTLPLSEEVTKAADEHAARQRTPVTVTVGGQARDLPPAATMALLRIAQEGLVNAAKHAPRQPIDLRLDYGDHDVRLTISNPLTRSWPATEAGRTGAGRTLPGLSEPGLSTVNGRYGLTGMQERLLLVNGTLSADRRDDRWVVTATVPHTPMRPAPARPTPAPAQAGQGDGPDASGPGAGEPDSVPRGAGQGKVVS